MSRDRLAAARAVRQPQTGTQFLEMDDLAGSESTNHGLASTGTTSGFFTEVSSIQEDIERINGNVNNVAILHARVLDAMDRGQTRDAEQLEQLTTETRTLVTNVKERIKALERTPLGRDAQMRKNRAAFVRSKFLEAIQNYQRIEQEYRAKSRQRVERQLRIVKPDATPEEVAAVTDGGGQQIFAQVLSQSSRYGESRIAFREVQERQQELRRMEETLAELAQLFTDMGTLIEQQDETIDAIETTATAVEQDTERATDHTWRAVISARHYRKGRWICFGIFMIILIIIAIVLAVTLTKH